MSLGPDDPLLLLRSLKLAGEKTGAVEAEGALHLRRNSRRTLDGVHELNMTMSTAAGTLPMPKFPVSSGASFTAVGSTPMYSPSPLSNSPSTTNAGANLPTLASASGPFPIIASSGSSPAASPSRLAIRQPTSLPSPTSTPVPAPSATSPSGSSTNLPVPNAAPSSPTHTALTLSPGLTRRASHLAQSPSSLSHHELMQMPHSHGSPLPHIFESPFMLSASPTGSAIANASSPSGTATAIPNGPPGSPPILRQPPSGFAVPSPNSPSLPALNTSLSAASPAGLSLGPTATTASPSLNAVIPPSGPRALSGRVNYVNGIAPGSPAMAIAPTLAPAVISPSNSVTNASPPLGALPTTAGRFRPSAPCASGASMLGIQPTGSPGSAALVIPSSVFAAGSPNGVGPLPLGSSPPPRTHTNDSSGFLEARPSMQQQLQQQFQQHQGYHSRAQSARLIGAGVGPMSAAAAAAAAAALAGEGCSLLAHTYSSRRLSLSGGPADGLSLSLGGSQKLVLAAAHELSTLTHAAHLAGYQSGGHSGHMSSPQLHLQTQSSQHVLMPSCPPWPPPQQPREGGGSQLPQQRFPSPPLRQLQQQQQVGGQQQQPQSQQSPRSPSPSTLTGNLSPSPTSNHLNQQPPLVFRPISMTSARGLRTPVERPTVPLLSLSQQPIPGVRPGTSRDTRNSDPGSFDGSLATAPDPLSGPVTVDFAPAPMAGRPSLAPLPASAVQAARAATPPSMPSMSPPGLGSPVAPASPTLSHRSPRPEPLPAAAAAAAAAARLVSASAPTPLAAVSGANVAGLVAAAAGNPTPSPPPIPFARANTLAPMLPCAATATTAPGTSPTSDGVFVTAAGPVAESALDSTPDLDPAALFRPVLRGPRFMLAPASGTAQMYASELPESRFRPRSLSAGEAGSMATAATSAAITGGMELTVRSMAAVSSSSNTKTSGNGASGSKCPVQSSVRQKLQSDPLRFHPPAGVGGVGVGIGIPRRHTALGSPTFDPLEATPRLIIGPNTPSSPPRWLRPLEGGATPGAGTSGTPTTTATTATGLWVPNQDILFQLASRSNSATAGAGARRPSSGFPFTPSPSRPPSSTPSEASGSPGTSGRIPPPRFRSFSGSATGDGATTVRKQIPEQLLTPQQSTSTVAPSPQGPQQRPQVVGCKSSYLQSLAAAAGLSESAGGRRPRSLSEGGCGNFLEAADGRPVGLCLEGGLSVVGDMWARLQSEQHHNTRYVSGRRAAVGAAEAGGSRLGRRAVECQDDEEEEEEEDEEDGEGENEDEEDRMSVQLTEHASSDNSATGREPAAAQTAGSAEGSEGHMGSRASSGPLMVQPLVQDAAVGVVVGSSGGRSRVTGKGGRGGGVGVRAGGQGHRLDASVNCLPLKALKSVTR